MCSAYDVSGQPCDMCAHFSAERLSKDERGVANRERERLRQTREKEGERRERK
jgi:hypothetical protein